MEDATDLNIWNRWKKTVEGGRKCFWVDKLCIPVKLLPECRECHRREIT